MHTILSHTFSLTLASLSLSIFSQHGIKVFFFFFNFINKKWMGGGGGGGGTNEEILLGCDYNSTIPTGSRALLGYKKTTVSHNFKTYGSS